MALYQPSNITPSTLAGVGQGTVAIADAPVITWQINGTSAMTGYQIDVINGNGDVTSTNYITTGCPAYGTDAKGNITPFTYTNATGNWMQDFNMYDGEQYKLKIYQFYGSVSVPRFTISAAISKGLICQFGISGTYYTFVCPEDLAVNTTIDVHQGNLLVFGYNNGGHISTAYATLSSSYDGTSIQISGTASTASNVPEIVVQNSEVVFLARTAPSIAFYPPASISTVARTFTATYTQAQGDSIKWARWQLKQGGVLGNGTIVDDTGEVSTGILSYTYDGFINRSDGYSIKLTVETENGVQATTGWRHFSVTYNVGTALTGVKAECSEADGSIKLSWASAKNIPGTATCNYTMKNSEITTSGTGNITWNTVDGDPMNYPGPQISYAWKGDVYGLFSQLSQAFQNNNTVRAKFSPNGSYLLISGYTSTDLYAVSGKTLTYKSTINQSAQYITISPDGHTIVLDDKMYIHEDMVYIDGVAIEHHVSYLLDIPNGGQYPSAFSPSGLYLFHGRYVHKYQNARITESLEITDAPATVNAIATYPTSDSVRLVVIGNRIFTYYFDDAAALAQPDYFEELQINGATGLNVTGLAFTNGGRYLAAIVSGSPAIFYNNVVAVPSLTFVRYLDDNGTITDAKVIAGTNAAHNSGDGYVAISTMSHGVQIYFVNRNGSSNYIGSLKYNTTTVPEGSGLLDFNPTDNLLISGYFNYFPILYFVPIDYSQLLLQMGADTGGQVTITQNGTDIDVGIDGFTTSSEIPFGTQDAIISMTPTEAMWQYFIGNVRINTDSDPVYEDEMSSGEMPGIESVTLPSGVICDWIYITQNPNYDYTFSQKPAYDGATAFFADFDGTLDGGSSESTGRASNAIYRLDTETGILTKLYTLPFDDTKIKDFGLRSMADSKYRLYYLSSTTGAYSSAAETDQLCKRFASYYLIEATEDADNANVFHALKVWRFGNNYNGGGVQNGNAPNFLTNFTRYPLRQGTSVSPKSGSLTALLSNFGANGYEDTATQMDALYELSLSQNHIFLKDTKGNLYEVHTSAPITMTIDTASRVQEVSVTVPWQEVADASDAVIIQTSDDEGWSD